MAIPLQALSDPGPLARFRTRWSRILLGVMLVGVLALTVSWAIEGRPGLESVAWRWLGPAAIAVTGMGIGAALCLTPAVVTVTLFRLRGKRHQLPVGGLRASGVVSAVLLLVGVVFGPAFRRDWRPEFELRTELRNLFAAQELVHRARDAYATKVEELGLEPAEGVTLTVRPTTDGYVARATMRDVRGACFLYVGTEAAGPAVESGRPACEELEVGASRVRPLTRAEVTRLLLLAVLSGALSMVGIIAVGLRAAGPADDAPVAAPRGPPSG